MQEYKPVEPGAKLKIAEESDECVDQQLYYTYSITLNNSM